MNEEGVECMEKIYNLWRRYIMYGKGVWRRYRIYGEGMECVKKV